MKEMRHNITNQELADVLEDVDRILEVRFAKIEARIAALEPRNRNFLAKIAEDLNEDRSEAKVVEVLDAIQSELAND